MVPGPSHLWPRLAAVPDSPSSRGLAGSGVYGLHVPPCAWSLAYTGVPSFAPCVAVLDTGWPCPPMTSCPQLVA